MASPSARRECAWVCENVAVFLLFWALLRRLHVVLSVVMLLADFEQGLEIMSKCRRREFRTKDFRVLEAAACEDCVSDGCFSCNQIKAQGKSAETTTPLQFGTSASPKA
ncbi:hypothetical protein HDK64DRAFT_51365 [Phyllosticta capitalensis]